VKLAHLVVIRVFAKEEEDYAKIIEKLRFLVPFNLEEEKILLKESIAEGFNNKKIRIAELRIEKTTLINSFLKRLSSMLNDKQVEMLLRDAEKRIDENLDFCMRLDKKRLLEKNECWITDSGECYHIRISIAAFPKKIKNALEVLNQIFTKENQKQQADMQK